MRFYTKEIEEITNKILNVESALEDLEKSRQILITEGYDISKIKTDIEQLYAKYQALVDEKLKLIDEYGPFYDYG